LIVGFYVDGAILDRFKFVPKWKKRSHSWHNITTWSQHEFESGSRLSQNDPLIPKWLHGRLCLNDAITDRVFVNGVGDH